MGSLGEADDTDGWTLEESGVIASQALRDHTRDRALASELGRPEGTTTPVSSAYIRELGQRPRLTGAREHKLVGRAKAGDYDARAELVEAFLPLIGSVARSYRGSPQVTGTELVQEGVVGLLRALERYDPERGAPFWAYAAWWVRQAMQQLVADLTRPVVMSDRALRQLARLKDAYLTIQRERGDAPTVTELVQRTGLEPEQLANLLAADRVPRALDEPIEGEDGAVGTFGELIADPLAEDEYERVVSRVTVGELRDLLSGLSDRERAVLRARFGLDGREESLRQIASRLGVSAERVRQIETRALGKLHAAATGARDHTDPAKRPS